MNLLTNGLRQCDALREMLPVTNALAKNKSGGLQPSHTDQEAHPMTEKLQVHAAANALAPALAELQRMGFEVSHAPNILGEACYRAEGTNLVLTAADTLQLLGLAVLAQRRGNNACQATDAEVEALLLLEGAV
jgi:hypothetical protein